LVVDDELLNRELLEDMLTAIGYEVDTAGDGRAGLAALGPHIDLALLDVMMPGMSGFELCRTIRQHPDCEGLPIIMVTALSGKEDRLQAVEAGANDFITKPIDRTELQVRVASLMRMKEAQDAIKRHKEKLEETVRERTADLETALHELAGSHRNTQAAYLETIHRLAMAAEYRDQHTAEHIHRVSKYCEIIARSLALPEIEIEIVLRASAMHDVGKIGISDTILLKPGPLTPAERKTMEQHTVIGAHILSRSESAILRAAEEIARSHHEKWDGTGYPYGLKGEEIPLFGRICAIADVFDALTSTRPYKPALSCDDACKILIEGRGTHFDPLLLELFFENLEEVMSVQAEFGEPAAEFWRPAA
jgi:putative two-component system response regulator